MKTATYITGYQNQKNGGISHWKQKMDNPSSFPRVKPDSNHQIKMSVD